MCFKDFDGSNKDIKMRLSNTSVIYEAYDLFLQSDWFSVRKYEAVTNYFGLKSPCLGSVRMLLVL